MIRQIFSGIAERLSDSFCGNKIGFMYRAYGAAYDFCRFYSAESGVIMIFNSNITADILDDDEAVGFIEFSSPGSAEIRDISCVISGMEKTVCEYMYRRCGISRGIPADIAVNCGFSDMYDIVGKCFPGTDRGLWYTDISHCVRHGLTDTFMIKDTAAVRADDHGGYAYLSAAAVVPEKRGRGFCRIITDAADSALCGRFGELRLCASGSNIELYRHLGFGTAGETAYFVKG